MYLMLIFITVFITVFITWIIFEKRNSRRLIRIPIILLLAFIIFITGISFTFYFFHLEVRYFNQNMKILENRLRSNNLYSVKTSITTYNQTIKTMNNYNALKYMNQILLDIDGKLPKKFCEEDSLMKTNNKIKNFKVKSD